MASVLDVARYILLKKGEMTAMKLQKLAYYSQAWSLVWDEKPLFNSRFEAWANGPVAPDLYQWHRGNFMLSPATFTWGDAAALMPQEQATVDGVLAFYGDQTAQWLSDLTHMEAPWKDTRAAAGVPDGVPSAAEIPLGAMHEYYSGLRR